MTAIIERENRWTLPDLTAARAWCRERNRQQIACTLHVLDEYTQSRTEVDAVTAAYRETIEGISGDGVDAAISVKLSSLGALFDADLAIGRSYELCKEAREHGVGFEIDMEGRDLVGTAIEAASLCARKGLPVTLALQAYLYRTPGDLRVLLALGVIPRFVKGAYLGDMEDLQDGTHDPVILPEIRSLMADHRDRITFGFLMGLSDRTKQEMAAGGWQVSEYVPFGKDAGPYVARRERYLRELDTAGRTAAE
ncbi:MAG: hypothetical protein GKC05_07830 [Methanomicrobiales archaeon]|nr:hypothetical protein [Methanomicrobiales archaeon]